MKSYFLKLSLLCISIIIIFSLFSYAENIKYYPAQPVAITCPGQNPDGLMVKVVLEKENVDFFYHPFLEAENLETYPTIFISVGHSCKGVGAAGMDFDSELQRSKDLIEEARAKNKFIILTHFGGKNRREERSDKLLKVVAPYADYMIISKSSNFDNYFSAIAMKYNIPLAEADNLSQIKPIISNLFNSKSKNVEYFVNGDQSDKTIIINAGIHGNEIASQLAALRLKKAEVDGGRLVVIPRANPKAIAAGKRNSPDDQLLNRSFPGKIGASTAENRAAEIFNLIEKFSPVLLLDLHESEEFNSINKKFVGQSIIAYPDDNSIWQASQTVELINEGIDKDIEKFVLITPPKTGSLAQAVGKHLNIPAFTLESCKKLELKKRIDYQIELITLLLKINGVELRWP
jgi:predicted nuclease of predicted toxin-antitoxin system